MRLNYLKKKGPSFDFYVDNPAGNDVKYQDHRGDNLNGIVKTIGKRRETRLKTSAEDDDGRKKINVRR